MPFSTRKSLFPLSLLAILAVLLFGGFVWSGIYNIAADDPHTRPVHALVEAMRERSIAARTADVQVPDLRDATRIAQGAGNYDAMCTGCHLRPGVAGTELSRGLYPAPPDLTAGTVDAAKAFWVIKHGIKGSGMPAWGRSMNDAYIWDMVAFLQQLPKLDEAGYAALVARSGGHSHGGGESGGHAGAGEAGAATQAREEARSPGTPADAPSAARRPEVKPPREAAAPPAKPARDAQEAAEATEPPVEAEEHEHEHQH